MMDEMFLRVVRILTYYGSHPQTNASGFFFLQQKFLYLITARHVVIDEAADHYPDRLQLSLHASSIDLQQRAEVTVPLYVNGVPQWFQHPAFGSAVDVVAVAVNEPHLISALDVATFADDDLLSESETLSLGQDVLIIGFPLGFYDTLHNLPIVRSATIATSYAHPFKGQPYFLTDARLHRGMSGAPVVVKRPRWTVDEDQHEAEWRLLGIHTSSLDVSDRDPAQDERLALNTTWYATLIREMLPGRAIADSILP